MTCGPAQGPGKCASSWLALCSFSHRRLTTALAHKAKTMESKWSLTPAQVDTWKIPTGGSEPEWTGWLSTDELATAARFHLEADRRRYIVAHAALRLLLGQYLGTAPQEIEFHLGPNGKPAVLAARTCSGVEFNLSHAHDLVLIALASERRVGIDVEFVRPVPDAEDIVQRFFSEKERTAFFALPAELRQEAFFNGWTRKEAFVKALGAGLGYPFDSFDVSLDSTAAIAVREDSRHGAEWSLFAFVPKPNYAAALVVEGTGCRTQFRDWTNDAAHLFA